MASEARSSISERRKRGLIAAVVILFVALLGAIVLLYGQLHKAETDGKATVACLDTGSCHVGVSFSDSIPGFRVKNGKEYFGFDVDMANYLTQRLGRGAPVFVQADRDQSLTDPGKPVDMYISTVSMTDERLEKMLFVGPYMRTFQGVMVTTTSPIKSRGDLDHRSVCVAEDTTSSKALAAYAAAHPVDMRTEATTEQCIKNMKTGKYDAVTGDYITLQTNAHSDATLRPLPSIRLSDGYELYGIALPKDSRALCEKLKPFLKDFIREKWEPAFASNLQPLGITYDPTNSNVPSLKPGENLIDINSCKG